MRGCSQDWTGSRLEIEAGRSLTSVAKGRFMDTMSHGASTCSYTMECIDRWASSRHARVSSFGTQLAVLRTMTSHSFFHIGVLSSIVFLGLAHSANAQVLVASDDEFAVPYGLTLVVETFGVLENDTLDDQNAGESGATAELLIDAIHGTLALATDGSFTYSPGLSFDGSDSFVYQAVSVGATPAVATVQLTACSGGPQIFTCWNETAFLAKVAELGHPSFEEGFEDDAIWGGVRSPNSALSVSNLGVEWRANDFDPTHTVPSAPPTPPPHQLTTGTGAALTGLWGAYDPLHGYAWGTPAECDIDNPPAHCQHHDGLTIRREAGLPPFFGFGGYFTGTHGANVGFVLDGDYLNPIGGGTLVVGPYVFFGVIDAGPTGFTELQFRELDGKIGQPLFIWADDFTILAEPSAARVPTLSPLVILALGFVLMFAASWQLHQPGRA